jgi:hypothetical protein
MRAAKAAMKAEERRENMKGVAASPNQCGMLNDLLETNYGTSLADVCGLPTRIRPRDLGGPLFQIGIDKAAVWDATSFIDNKARVYNVADIESILFANADDPAPTREEAPAARRETAPVNRRDEAPAAPAAKLPTLSQFLLGVDVAALKAKAMEQLKGAWGREEITDEQFFAVKGEIGKVFETFGDELDEFLTKVKAIERVMSTPLDHVNVQKEAVKAL